MGNSKSTICEHKYDNFPGVNKAKWMELLDSWKIGGRFVRPSFLQTNCSAQSSVSPISDCSTEGNATLGAAVCLQKRWAYKATTYFPTV
jgi:hypothetical protein